MFAISIFWSIPRCTWDGGQDSRKISDTYSRFSGEVVELVVSALVFNPALLPDDETLLRAYSKLSTLACFNGEEAEVAFEGVFHLCKR